MLHGIYRHIKICCCCILNSRFLIFGIFCSKLSVSSVQIFWLFLCIFSKLFFFLAKNYVLISSNVLAKSKMLTSPPHSESLSLSHSLSSAVSHSNVIEKLLWLQHFRAILLGHLLISELFGYLFYSFPAVTHIFPPFLYPICVCLHFV